jgi:hypothetical protein
MPIWGLGFEASLSIEPWALGLLSKKGWCAMNRARKMVSAARATVIIAAGCQLFGENRSD